MQGQYGDTPWELEIVQVAAAEILWACGEWLPGRAETKNTKGKCKKHTLCVTMAHRQFFKDPELLKRIRKDVADG